MRWNNFDADLWQEVVTEHAQAAEARVVRVARMRGTVASETNATR